jgi:hypothetical protein
VYYALKDAFMVKDPAAILKISAELGHYVADAHVPLHTTENYNGQLTGQEGIHGFWESRLPELYSEGYDFFVGKAQYVQNVQEMAWSVVEDSHLLVDSVLTEERRLASQFAEKKYSFETKGKQTIKVYSTEYAQAYHTVLNGMVERQMRAAVGMIGDLWYSAWIDAGQPDLKKLIDYRPSEKELERNREELELWKEKTFKIRTHEDAEK